MQKALRNTYFVMFVFLSALVFAACSSASPSIRAGDTTNEVESTFNEDSSKEEEFVRSAVNFEHELDSYVPQKDHYNFYFTYKTVHPWWDAVALGMEEAQRQFLDKGIIVTYEYMAPEGASADDQTERFINAEQKNYDVIGVDVADETVISPIIDGMEIVATDRAIAEIAETGRAMDKMSEIYYYFD